MQMKRGATPVFLILRLTDGGATNHITFCEAKDLVVELHLANTTEAHVDLFVSLLSVELVSVLVVLSSEVLCQPF